MNGDFTSATNDDDVKGDEMAVDANVSVDADMLWAEDPDDDVPEGWRMRDLMVSRFACSARLQTFR